MHNYTLQAYYRSYFCLGLPTMPFSNIVKFNGMDIIPHYPCACTDSILGTIHIMWVRFEPSSAAPNHIIPLLKRSKFSVGKQHGTVSFTKTDNEAVEGPVPAIENGSNLGFVTEFEVWPVLVLCTLWYFPRAQ